MYKLGEDRVKKHLKTLNRNQTVLNPVYALYVYVEMDMDTAKSKKKQS